MRGPVYSLCRNGNVPALISGMWMRAPSRVNGVVSQFDRGAVNASLCMQKGSTGFVALSRFRRAREHFVTSLRWWKAR